VSSNGLSVTQAVLISRGGENLYTAHSAYILRMQFKMPLGITPDRYMLIAFVLIIVLHLSVSSSDT
jgi:hypothetical protein